MRVRFLRWAAENLVDWPSQGENGGWGMKGEETAIFAKRSQDGILKMGRRARGKTLRRNGETGEVFPP